jgi:hypothetical protein
MTTATRQRQAEAHSATHAGGASLRAPASRRQVKFASVVVAVLAAGTIVGALALGRDHHEASGRFAVPHFNDAHVVKGARGGTFGDPQVVKGARGGTFNDPVVRKGAGGAPIG